MERVDDVTSFLAWVFHIFAFPFKALCDNRADIEAVYPQQLPTDVQQAATPASMSTGLDLHN